jgi:hypothetical protein
MKAGHYLQTFGSMKLALTYILMTKRNFGSANFKLDTNDCMNGDLPSYHTVNVNTKRGSGHELPFSEARYSAACVQTMSLML